LQKCAETINLSAHSNKGDQGCQPSGLRSGGGGSSLPQSPKENGLELDVRRRAEVNVIRMRGDLKMGPPVDSLRGAIEEILENGDSAMVLNLADVPMIDSSGIGILVRSLTSAKQRGGTVKLVNPSKFALQTLKLVGVVNLFEIFQDENAAVESFA
jgi:anti-sigma B factor antagonist